MSIKIGDLGVKIGDLGVDLFVFYVLSTLVAPADNSLLFHNQVFTVLTALCSVSPGSI